MVILIIDLNHDIIFLVKKSYYLNHSRFMHKIIQHKFEMFNTVSHIVYEFLQTAFTQQTG